MSATSRDNWKGVAIKGPYEAGVKVQMTEDWKDLVRKVMKDQGWSQARLEERIGAGSGQISRMLARSQNTSVWVPKVCEALRLPPPGQESGDEALLLENFRAATEEGRRALLQHAAAAAGVGKKSEN